MPADLVAMLEITIAPRPDQPEVGCIGEELVACGDVDGLAVELDPPEATVPAAALPVDAHRVPVEDARGPVEAEVHEVDATMAFALAAAAHDRCCNEDRQDAVRI